MREGGEMTKQQIKAEIKELMKQLVDTSKSISQSTKTSDQMLGDRRRISQRVCGLRMQLEAIEKSERGQK